MRITRSMLAGYGQSLDRREKLRAMAFPAQRAFLDDRALFKAELCTRRAGKSFGIGIDIAETHERYPGDSSIYIGLTRETARLVMWKDILDEIDARVGIGWQLNRQEQSYTHPNGAVTYFRGLDSSPKEMQKTLGQKIRRIWIDEAQGFTIDLRQLVYQKLKPALADLRGQLSLHGTPGDFIGPQFAPDGFTPGRHLFFAVTKQEGLFPSESREGGWSVTRRSTLDNPHMRVQFLEQIAEIERDRPLFKETPQFVRDYLGQWAVASNRLVYRYGAVRNGIEESAVPMSRIKAWVIGVDFGYDDPTAFAVGGWADYDPTLYIVRAYKRPRMTLTAVADELRLLQADFPGARIVVDGAVKQAVEELKMRERLPLITAQKAGKHEFIQMMNSDLIEGKVKVVADACVALTDEYQALVWDDRTMVPKELASCDNHLCDGALYLWRDARNFIVREAPKRKTIEDEMAAIVAREDREGRAASVGEDDGDGDGEVWEDA